MSPRRTKSSPGAGFPGQLECEICSSAPAGPSRREHTTPLERHGHQMHIGGSERLALVPVGTVNQLSIGDKPIGADMITGSVGLAARDEILWDHNGLRPLDTLDPLFKAK